MTNSRAASRFLVAFLLAAGCASEGGVTGTGLSAIVAGHVSEADGSAATRVEVSVEDSRTVTDADGNFELAGEIAGDVELRFRDEVSGADLGALPLSVPPGSTTVLENIALDAASGQALPANVVRQGSVGGTIRFIDCGAAAVIITLGNGAAFPFALAETVVIQDGSGAVVGCADLRRNDRIEASGVQLANGDSIAYSIVVTDRAPEPVSEFEIEFGGSVNNLYCDENRMRVIVLTAADPYLANVRGLAASELLCADGAGVRECSCADISTRDIVQIRGAVSVDQPDAVRAASVLVFPGPALVEVPVVALRVGCGIGKIETEAAFATTRQIIIARFPADASFDCEGAPCACTDLHPGDHLRLFGSPIVSNGRPYIDAIAVTRSQP